ncbi:MAG TPA: methyltransferase domain-containing protein [Rectinemataceae bacterium]|nr:methyltransferase domain-containing protein [Rectinemataceae bacterium]
MSGQQGLDSPFRCHPGGNELIDRAIKFCDFPPGSRIWDLGCGAGSTVRRLTEFHGLDALGIDSEVPVGADRIRIVQGEATHIPAAEASAAGILMECSFSLMPQAEVVLAECFRVLVVGGRLILATLYARGEGAELGPWLGRVEPLASLIERLERAGFALESIEDASGELGALWARLYLERGGEELRAALGTDTGRLKEARCGYCLLIARKAG